MYFLHEHPYSASSWDVDEVTEISEMESVKIVNGDMCAFGMYRDTEQGRKLVMKPTGFMTNGDEIAKELGKSCDGKHTHTHQVIKRTSEEG